MKFRARHDVVTTRVRLPERACDAATGQPAAAIGTAHDIARATKNRDGHGRMFATASGRESGRPGRAKSRATGLFRGRADGWLRTPGASGPVMAPTRHSDTPTTRQA